ncbi:uncharacterized protein [Typha latifolia]|uniref:uncharacterized protein n=1 Tax=Typha latifolia TaxID=4733 RepID=UPI003C2C1620
MGDEGEDALKRRASSSKSGRARTDAHGSAKMKAQGRSWASVAAMIDPETLECCRARWKLTLFGRFLGKGIPLMRLKAILGKLCNGIEGFSVSDMQEGFYAFWFERQEDLTYALTNGPWTILGKVLNLIPWRNNFWPSMEAFATAPVWIQLHNLPKEYWELEALVQVAAYFGKPLRIDETTLDHSCSWFGRVCIEVDLRHPLKTAVWLGPKEDQLEQTVIYESIPKFCYFCGMIGHKAEGCPSASSTKNGAGCTGVEHEMSLEQGGDQPGQEQEPAEPGSVYGPWFTVQH